MSQQRLSLHLCLFRYHWYLLRLLLSLLRRFLSFLQFIQ